MDLQRIDLNLMVAFEALMSERSVSAAARRLGLSQPALSASLARLRALFDDELFVRSGTLMLPTQRARDLEARIAPALAQFRAALDPPSPFDPRTSRRAFNVSGGDYAAMLVLPRLAARLARDAPNVDLRFRFVEKDEIFSLIDAGALDLALGVFPDPPKRLGMRTLLEDRFVCLARRDHPRLREGMTIDAFASLSHLLVTERGDAVGAVDEALAKVGRQRRIALTIPHVLAAPLVLPRTDLIATVGSRAAAMFARDAALQLYETPVEIPPWRLSMLWSRQRAGDAGLDWLRETLAEIGAEL